MCGLFFLLAISYAQPIDSISADTFSFELPSPRCMYEWSTGWKDEAGNVISLPNIQEIDDNPVYVHTFDLPCILEDSAFIIIEGLAWKGQCELNGAFLGLHKRPLKHWAIPVAPGFFKETNNEIRIQAFAGNLVDFSVEPFTGLLGPVFLMTREQYEHYALELPKGTAPSEEVVAALVPWEERAGFAFKPFDIALALQSAYKQDVEYVWFPVYADRSMIQFCRDAGFSVVASIAKEQEIIWYNPFPYAPESFAKIPKFWLDEDGRRSLHYGHFKQTTPPDTLPWSIIILGLIPLCMAATLRVFGPTAYKSMWVAWQSPARGMDNWFEVLLSNRTANLLIALLRVTQIAVVLSLWVWVLRSEALLSWLNIIKDWSILNQLFNAVQHPLLLFSKAFLLVLAIVGSLFIVNTVLGIVFKRGDFAFAVLATEGLSSFPVLWILGIVLLLSLIIAPGLRFMALGLVLIFFVWRVVIFYLNAEKRLGITGGVKYLYICASIFPYLLLF